MSDLRPAVFSDVEGTLIRISFPRTYFNEARAMGVVPMFNVVSSAALSLIAKPFGTKSRLSGILRYMAMTRAMHGLHVSLNPGVMERVNPLLRASLKTETITRIQAYERQGMPVILLSAAFDLALKSFAESFGWRGEGTRFIIENGIFTGRADTPLSGEAKAVRAREVEAEMGLDLGRSVGFGDTVTDVPFLSLMGTAHVVDPDDELRAIASSRGWTVIETTS